MENKNVWLKVCVCVGGGAQTYHCPPSKDVGGHMPPLPPPASYASVTAEFNFVDSSSKNIF